MRVFSSSQPQTKTGHLLQLNLHFFDRDLPLSLFSPHKLFSAIYLHFLLVPSIRNFFFLVESLHGAHFLSQTAVRIGLCLIATLPLLL